MVRNSTGSAGSKVQRKSSDTRQPDNTYDPRATAWLKPRQVNTMRSATVASSAIYLAARNDALLALLYETGLRVGELVQLDVEMLDFENDAVVGTALLDEPAVFINT